MRAGTGDVVLRHGVVERRGRVVLQPAELTLPRGSVTGLAGINGSGKSTLMMAAAGVLRSTRGRVEIEYAAPDRVGYAPQRPTFPAWLRASAITRMHGHEMRDLMHRYPGLLLDEIERARPGALSAGQLQTLSVALALASNADLILLDEPFAPLDFRRRIGLAAILRAAQPRGAIVVSSQSAAELIDACYWLIVLREGRYVLKGAISDLIGDAAGDGARRVLESVVVDAMADSR